MAKGNRAGTAFFHPNYLPIPSPHRPAYYLTAAPEKSGQPQRRAPRPRRSPPQLITCKQCIVSLAVWAAQPCCHWVLCDNCFAWASFVRCSICGRRVRYYQHVNGDRQSATG